MSEPIPEDRWKILANFFDDSLPHTVRPTGLERELFNEIQRMRKRWTPESELSAAELLMLLDKNQARKSRYIARYGVKTYLGLCDRARREA